MSFQTRYHYRPAPVSGGTRLTLDGRSSAEGLPGPAARLGGLAERIIEGPVLRDRETVA